tara:strand:- start:270 stop:536 length:267 start_codon:yes stop_codon:yes gene_type:complete
MIKTVSTMNAKKNLGEILDKIRLQQDEYVIESNGKPAAVIVPVNKFKKWKKRRNQDFGVLDAIKKKSPYATDKEIQSVLKDAIKKARA